MVVRAARSARTGPAAADRQRLRCSAQHSDLPEERSEVDRRRREPDRVEAQGAGQKEAEAGPLPEQKGVDRVTELDGERRQRRQLSRIDRAGPWQRDELRLKLLDGSDSPRGALGAEEAEERADNDGDNEGPDERVRVDGEAPAVQRAAICTAVADARVMDEQRAQV